LLSMAATRGKGDTGKGQRPDEGARARARGQGQEGKGKRARADKGARARARVDMADDNSS
jgi:hypothetical protein